MSANMTQLFASVKKHKREGDQKGEIRFMYHTILHQWQQEERLRKKPTTLQFEPCWDIVLARFHRRNIYRVVETELRRNARLLMFKLVESDPLGFIDRSAFEKSKIIDSYLDENEWLSRIPGLLPDSLSALTSTSKFSRISSMLSKVGRLEGFGSQHLVSRSFSIFEEKFFRHGREFVSTTFVRRASKQMPFPKGFFSAHISQRRIPNE